MKKHTARTDAPLDIEVTYEDEETRMSYEIAAQVRYLDATIPPEPSDFAPSTMTIPIAFRAYDATRGEAAIFFIGDFMRVSDDETIHYIQPRTKRILDALGVQYDEVLPQRSESLG